MPCQFSSLAGSHTGRKLFQGVGHAPVEDAAARRAQIGYHSLMDEVVREGVEIAVKLDQQSRSQRFIQCGERTRLANASVLTTGDQECPVRDASSNSGELEKVMRVWRQKGEPLANTASDVLRRRPLAR